MNTNETIDEKSKLLPYEAPRMLEFLDRADVCFGAGTSDGTESEGGDQAGESFYGD